MAGATISEIGGRRSVLVAETDEGRSSWDRSVGAILDCCCCCCPGDWVVAGLPVDPDEGRPEREGVRDGVGVVVVNLGVSLEARKDWEGEVGCWARKE